MDSKRRNFLKQSAFLGTGFLLGSQTLLQAGNVTKSLSSFGLKKPLNEVLKISLAQWSFNKAFFSGKMDHLEFAGKAKELGFEGIEYVNQFFFQKASDTAYLKEMNMRANDAGIPQLLIMVDREGGLALTDDNKRNSAIEKHKKWLEAASTLGCHSIRVNAYGEGSPEDVASAAVDGLGRLAILAKPYNLNVIVENHGGYSSDGKWLSGVMKEINMDNCGTLPDFGNFCIERKRMSRECLNEYDKYLGMKELMPYAKAVSAKSHAFDEDGNEVNIDYKRIIKTVAESGFEGYIGVEYEGSELSAEEGIIKTRDLLRRVISELG